MLAGGQFDNLPAEVFPLPLRGERVGTLDAFEEGMRPHGTSDRERPEIVCEVKEAVPDLQPRNVFANVNWIVFKSPKTVWHSVHSPRSNIERFEIERDKLNRSNPGFPLPDINMGWFRPTAINPRRIAEPANDNDFPSGAEAA